METPTEINLNLKFLETSTKAERRSVIRQLEELGTTSVKRLFPGDSDPVLASSYVVVAPPKVAERAVQTVRSRPAVEFIMEQPQRWLAGPDHGDSA